jgi:hypothetical protein
MTPVCVVAKAGAVAVTVTAVSAVTAVVVTGNVALVWWLATTVSAGTTTAGLLLAS